MPKYRVRVVADATAFADVEIDADSESDALDKVLDDEALRNGARWELSDGNYLKRSDVWGEVDDVEEILS